MKELRKRLFFLLLSVIVYRIGAHIPVPGLDPKKLTDLFSGSAESIFSLFNLFSGGALSRLTIFALGIMPYISASIIMQLLTVIWPFMAQLKNEGNSGRQKIIQYTRYLTLLLAIFQAVGMAKFMSASTIDINFIYYITVISTLVSGTMFLMWLGEQISDKGIGNGISLIIFVGIVANLPLAVINTLEKIRQGDLSIFTMTALSFMFLLVILFVIFIERAQRKILVNYPKRQHGRKIYAAQKSHLPLKINMAGVIPPIFASSLILFPATIIQWFGSGFFNSDLLIRISLSLSPGQPVYILLFAFSIVFFCFFYTALIFNPKDTAENLKKSGGFLPGIRPGIQTSIYIDKVMTKLTIIGAGYITFVSLLPEFLVLFMRVPFYFGGTSLLIIVVVVMDFMAQVQSKMMSHKYEGLMKKAKLKELR